MARSGGSAHPVLEELVAVDRQAYALALRLVGSPQDAEDIVQQAYLKAVGKLRGEPPLDDARTWFMTVVANAAKDHLKTSGRRARKEAAVRASECAEKQEADAELIGALRTAVEGLDPEGRALVSLCCEQGYSQNQAARIMALPARTVSDRLRAALERLRSTLSAAGFTAAPAVIVSGLQHTAPAVPAGLAAFVQSLTATAGAGAAAVGKAAAGAALKISARFGAKKAAGLALGWKLGTVVTAASVGGAALVAANNGMFEKQKPVPAARAPAEVPTLSRHVDGDVILDDEFDGTLSNWEVVVGTRGAEPSPIAGYDSVYATIEKDFHGVRQQSEEAWGSCIVLNTQMGPDRFVGIRSRNPIDTERFAVEVRCGMKSKMVERGDKKKGLTTFWDCGIDVREGVVSTEYSKRPWICSAAGISLIRWEFEPAPDRGPGALRCTAYDVPNGKRTAKVRWGPNKLFKSCYMVPSSRKVLIGICGPDWDLVIDRVVVRELKAAE